MPGADRREVMYQIKTEYIAGDKSLRQLADEHGVASVGVERASVRENWVKLRKEYRQRVADEALKRAEKAAVKKLAAVQLAADKIADQIVRLAKDEDQFHRHITAFSRMSNGTMESGSEEHIFNKADTYALKNVTGALKDMVAIIRDVYGLRTAQQDADLEYARARVESERRKAQEEAGDGDIHVIMDEEADSYGE